MTAQAGTMSVDGTPISQADLARIQAEEKLHTEQQRSAARVVASASTDVEDCRMLLSILGLDAETVNAARAAIVAPAAPAAPVAPTKQATRKRHAA